MPHKPATQIDSSTSPTSLFDGDDALFKQVARSAQNYLEYGCGASTIWMAEHTQAHIVSVDTSSDWSNSVNQRLTNRPNCHVTHTDLGPIENWGRPIGYTHKDRFQNYFFDIWDRSNDTDLVLIDARFRVACFCASAIRAKPGTRIMFDDYTDRNYYHLVETILKPTQTCGRQALFEVTETIDKTSAQALLNKFEYVMD